MIIAALGFWSAALVAALDWCGANAALQINPKRRPTPHSKSWLQDIEIVEHA
jgi:hypothetical protein